MDHKAQISAEFILFAGLVILVVLIFAGIVSDQSELNSVTTAAKLGAENGTAQLSLLTPNIRPVRVTKINMVNTTNTTPTQYNIIISLSDAVSSTQNQTIMNSIMQSLAAQGYNVVNNTVTTNKHMYFIFINASNIS